MRDYLLQEFVHRNLPKREEDKCDDDLALEPAGRPSQTCIFSYVVGHVTM